MNSSGQQGRQARLSFHLPPPPSGPHDGDDSGTSTVPPVSTSMIQTPAPLPFKFRQARRTNTTPRSSSVTGFNGAPIVPRQQRQQNLFGGNMSLQNGNYNSNAVDSRQNASEQQQKHATLGRTMSSFATQRRRRTLVSQDPRAKQVFLNFSQAPVQQWNATTATGADEIQQQPQDWSNYHHTGGIVVSADTNQQPPTSKQSAAHDARLATDGDQSQHSPSVPPQQQTLGKRNNMNVMVQKAEHPLGTRGAEPPPELDDEPNDGYHHQVDGYHHPQVAPSPTMSMPGKKQPRIQQHHPSLKESPAAYGTTTTAPRSPDRGAVEAGNSRVVNVNQTFPKVKRDLQQSISWTNTSKNYKGNGTLVAAARNNSMQQHDLGSQQQQHQPDISGMQRGTRARPQQRSSAGASRSNVPSASARPQAAAPVENQTTPNNKNGQTTVTRNRGSSVPQQQPAPQPAPSRSPAAGSLSGVRRKTLSFGITAPSFAAPPPSVASDPLHLRSNEKQQVLVLQEEETGETLSKTSQKLMGYVQLITDCDTGDQSSAAGHLDLAIPNHQRGAAESSPDQPTVGGEKQPQQQPVAQVDIPDEATPSSPAAEDSQLSDTAHSSPLSVQEEQEQEKEELEDVEEHDDRPMQEEEGKREYEEERLVHHGTFSVAIV